MEVLIQDCTEPGRAHATKLYGDFLLSLSLTPITTTTTTAAAAAAAAAAATVPAAFFKILSSFTYYTHTSTAT